MSEAAGVIVLTDPDVSTFPAAVDAHRAWTELELRWLWKQRAKMLGSRSKYVPHQGTQERARRVACAR